MDSNQKLTDQFNNYLKEEKKENIASIQNRIFAYIIDLIICFMTIIICALLMLLIKQIIEENSFEWIFVLMTIIISLVITVYLFFRDGFNGQGIGKRIMKIQVIHAA